MGTATERAATDRTEFFIGGEWVGPEGADTRELVEAATEQPLGVAALGSEADVDKAARAARAAFDHGPWGRSTVAERVAAMRAIAEGLRARADQTSELCT